MIDKIRKKSAFTLAETLITLGIIGIVAAMTLPVLIQNHKQKETVARLKKFYSTLQQAQLMAYNKHGDINDWKMSGSQSQAVNSEIYYNKIKEFLNLQDDCGLSTKCIKSISYLYRNKTKTGDFGTTPNFAKGVLTDGSMFFIEINHADCDYSNGAVANICGYISFDTNGYRKPNKVGDDFFYFIVSKDKIVPRGIPGTYTNFNDAFEGCYSSGGACAAWVIYNENLDYNHCTDLSWNGKTKCGH